MNNNNGLFNILNNFTFINSKSDNKNDLIILNKNSKSGISFDFFINNSSLVYLDVANLINSYSIYVNGELLKLNENYSNSDPHKIIEIGCFENSNVQVQIIMDDPINKPLYVGSTSIGIIDINQLISLQSNYNANYFSITGNKITTTLYNSKKDNVLFVPIANIPGWEASINNKKVTIENLFNGFIGIKLFEGINNITLEFQPIGLHLGLIVSLVGIIFLYIMQIINKKIIKLNFLLIIINIIYILLAFFSILIIYIIPFFYFFINILK